MIALCCWHSDEHGLDISTLTGETEKKRTRCYQRRELALAFTGSSTCRRVCFTSRSFLTSSRNCNFKPTTPRPQPSSTHIPTQQNSHPSWTTTTRRPTPWSGISTTSHRPTNPNARTQLQHHRNPRPAAMLNQPHLVPSRNGPLSKLASPPVIVARCLSTTLHG